MSFTLLQKTRLCLYFLINLTFYSLHKFIMSKNENCLVMFCRKFHLLLFRYRRLWNGSFKRFLVGKMLKAFFTDFSTTRKKDITSTVTCCMLLGESRMHFNTSQSQNKILTLFYLMIVGVVPSKILKSAKCFTNVTTYLNISLNFQRH